MQNPTLVIKRSEKKAQPLVTKWCDTLWLTGGCLRPDKCTWFLITFKWDKDGNWSYGSVLDRPFDLLIPNDQKLPHIIERKNCDDGVKGLGIFIQPTGTGKAQIIKMTEYSKKWSDAMKSSMISCFSAAIALDTTVKIRTKVQTPSNNNVGRRMQ